MAKLRSTSGRVMAGVFLLGAVSLLAYMIWTMVDRASWQTAEGTVTERVASGRSISVVVKYPGPNGTEVATISETGSAHHVGERVPIRYKLQDGQVSDIALEDASQAHIVMIVLASLATLGGLVVNLAAWGRVKP